MSLKSAPEAGGGDAPRASWSLAARLTLWYAASMFLLLLVATGFLYMQLAQYLEREDDQHLEAKLREVTGVLSKQPLDLGKLKQAVGVENVVSSQTLEPILVRVKTGDDKMGITETPDMSKWVPLGLFTAARGRPDFEEGKPYPLVSPIEGRPFRGLTRRVMAPGGVSYIVHGAADHKPELLILEQYRKTLWWVHSIGLVLCAFVGHLIARRGLRPISEMGQAMGQIRADTLDQRITAPGAPLELARLAVSFNTMLQGLQDAFDRLSRYSADIAHELRTPINNLRGEAEVALSRARTPEEYREVLGSCLEECQRLGSLINSLLFIARAENPANQIRLELIDLDREFAALEEFYSVLAADAEMRLEFEAEAGLTARLDRHLFQRAVGNLIENALKYSNKNAIVRVRGRSEGTTLVVSVKDQGQGIGPQHLPHIFDRFYRVDANRSKDTGGLGLGLAIVKTIATLHGGDVQVVSALEQGTTVTLSFPAAVTNAPGASAPGELAER